MPQAVAQDVKDPSLLFLPGVFNETLSLLFDAHHHFQMRGIEEQAAIEPARRMHYANEMSLVTLRLTSVMAWLMVRRAVYAGRIEEDTALTHYRLDGAESCLHNDTEALQDMPYYLRYLSERSHALYARIHRLDAKAYGPLSTPAHALQ